MFYCFIQGRRPPSVGHETLEDAVKEAYRLTSKEQEPVFVFELKKLISAPIDLKKHGVYGGH